MGKHSTGTSFPSPPPSRYKTITSWYRYEHEKFWQSWQLGPLSTSTMPIPTTPATITVAIREKVATTFDKLEVDVDTSGEWLRGDQGMEVTQKACCVVITYGGMGEGKMWGVEEGNRVVDWEGLSEQGVRNLCHFLPGMLEELGEVGEAVGGEGELWEDGEVEEGDELEDEDEDVPALAVTRERRLNAGNRMSKLLAKAREGGTGPTDEEYADLFQEVADDVEFKGEEGDEQDFNMDSSSEEEDGEVKEYGEGEEIEVDEAIEEDEEIEEDKKTEKDKKIEKGE